MVGQQSAYYKAITSYILVPAILYGGSLFSNASAQMSLDEPLGAQSLERVLSEENRESVIEQSQEGGRRRDPNIRRNGINRRRILIPRHPAIRQIVYQNRYK